MKHKICIAAERGFDDSHYLTIRATKLFETFKNTSRFPTLAGIVENYRQQMTRDAA